MQCIYCKFNSQSSYVCTQVEASKAEEVNNTSDSSQAIHPSETENVSVPASDLPTTDAPEAPPKDNTDVQPDDVNKKDDGQPESKDTAPVEQMETSPVKQPMVEEVVVTEVQDDTGGAPMDTSDPVLPVREQAEVIAESAAVVQPENSVAEVSIMDQPERKVEIQPETNVVVKQESVESAVRQDVVPGVTYAQQQQQEQQQQKQQQQEQQHQQQQQIQQQIQQQQIQQQQQQKQQEQQHQQQQKQQQQKQQQKEVVFSHQEKSPVPQKQPVKEPDIPKQVSLTQKLPQKQVFSQQVETPKVKVASEQSVTPSRETRSQEHVALVQKLQQQQTTQEIKKEKQQQITKEIKQEKKHEVVSWFKITFYACMFIEI